MPGTMRKRVYTDSTVREAAIDRLHHAFDLFDTISVAFSGGKDSMACLELTVEVARERDRLPVHAFFFDEEAIPHDTEHYVRRMQARDEVEISWYCLPVRHFNACARAEPWWFPWDPDKSELWVRDMPPEGIHEHPGFPSQPPEARPSIPDSNHIFFDQREHGQVGIIMGIRADESLVRYRAVVRKDAENFIIHTNPPNGQRNLYKVYPIYDWSTWDIWKAAHDEGWDHNRAYDVMEMAGIHPNNQRCAPPYGAEPIQGLWRFSQCWPELWDGMVERVEGAGAAARYARTELYHFGHVPEKPDDLTWEEFLAHYLRRFPRDHARDTAARIREEIQRHYANTSDPILESAVHPDTGLSWKFLVMLASRSDPKNRKAVTPPTGAEAKAEQRERYELERQHLVEQGKLDPRRRSGLIGA